MTIQVTQEGDGGYVPLWPLKSEGRVPVLYYSRSNRRLDLIDAQTSHFKNARLRYNVVLDVDINTLAKFFDELFSESYKKM